ncbi:MAG: ATP-dependent Clp protease adaptor ClpS [Lachnospiraceae bacterium]|nr:ATP-dependent Clp protease adaptor ClpS [Lachnospiraceae bacterium]
MANRESTRGQTGTGTRTRVREPKKYKVIMHNDNFTTMEFVVEVLVTIFHKNELEAEQLMLAVHQKGHAVVGIYSLDMATTRIRKATQRARAQGFPFRLTMEEE